MSNGWWIGIYAITASFLAWIAFGKGLKTLLGGVLADFLVEGPEHMSDRAIRRAAMVALVLETVWFGAGLIYPEIRWPF